MNPDLSEAGSETEPKAVPESKGIPDYFRQNTIILPFNNLEATEQILRKHKDELAAVILEPVQAGFIPANPEFIKGIRTITQELGILLIFDEVKTGFRMSMGGAQKVYDIVPDLTALGKVLGGGFPVGAVGGRKEIMMISAPEDGKDILTTGSKNGKKEVLFHSGTYNGHPTVLAAGLATIEVLEEEGQMDRLISATHMLRNQLEMVYAKYGFDMQTVGMGSIFNIMLTKEPIQNYRDTIKANAKIRKEIDQKLLRLGIYTKPLNRYSMSVVHTGEDIARTVEAHETVLKQLRR